MENLSLHPPPFIGVRVFDGQVILADAGQLKACVRECIGERGTIRDQTHRYLIEDPASQLIAPGGPIRRFGHALHISCS
jgi:hypothetical protein